MMNRYETGETAMFLDMPDVLFCVILCNLVYVGDSGERLFAQKSFQVPVAKNTSGILLLPAKVALNYASTGCIRCGRCVQGCPMHLMPCLLSTAIEADRFDLAAQNHVMDCMECGSCAYVCPDHRPLVQNIRRAKAELRKQSAKRN